MQELELIRSITAEVLGLDPEEIREKSRFVEDLGADSLELFEILTRVEEVCHLPIPTRDLGEVKRLGDAVSLLIEAEHKA